MGMADSHRAVRSVLWGVLKHQADNYRRRGTARDVDQDYLPWPVALGAGRWAVRIRYRVLTWLGPCRFRDRIPRGCRRCAGLAKAEWPWPMDRVTATTSALGGGR
jgi:hypothetical protein